MRTLATLYFLRFLEVAVVRKRLNGILEGKLTSVWNEIKDSAHHLQTTKAMGTEL